MVELTFRKIMSLLVCLVILLGVGTSCSSTPVSSVTPSAVSSVTSMPASSASLTPTEASPLSSSMVKYTVATDNLKVRSGPSTSASILGKLPEGAKLLGTVTDGWLQFTYNGQTGYCNASYLKVEASTSSTPSSAAPSSTAGRTLAVNYLSVGQGDSVFIELPTGQTMLIDAGNPGDGAGIVQFIKSKGYTKIDFLIATHPHADHIGGMADVIQGISISSIYMPKVANNTQTFENLLSTIKDKGLTVNTAKAGVSLIDITGLKVYMVAPIGTEYEDLNDYSAVVKIINGSTSFLFMGDAQSLSEDEILKTSADVKANVLKVGHHGSDTSTSQAFLQAVSPTIAVISVGADNDYGHPTQATLDELQNASAKVYRTDQNGNVIITSDGTTISVTTSDSSAIVGKSESGSPSGVTSTPTAPATTAAAAAPSPAAQGQPSTDEKQSVTVYVTKTGNKYHRAGCSYLKSSIPMTLADAKAQGIPL